MVAHEGLTEPGVTMEWLLAKSRSFPNFPGFFRSWYRILLKIFSNLPMLFLNPLFNKYLFLKWLFSGYFVIARLFCTIVGFWNNRIIIEYRICYFAYFVRISHQNFWPNHHNFMERLGLSHKKEIRASNLHKTSSRIMNWRQLVGFV